MLQQLAEATSEHTMPLQEAYHHLMHLAEAEICVECGAVNSQGLPSRKHIGRHLEPSFVWGPALPAHGGADGRTNSLSRALVWFSRRVRELACILDCQARGKPLTAATARQWHSITSTLRGCGKMGRQHSNQLRNDRWGWKLDGVSYVAYTDWFAAP